MLWRKLRLDWRYAIGELTIVVVGVLIALAVDQWNTGKGDRVRELEYVASLRLDFQADTAELSQAIALAETHSTSARSVLRSLESGAITETPEQFIRAVEFAGFLYFPAYSRYTFDDLMSTGNLRLIQDTGLKREMAAYYATIDRAEQWAENWRNIQRRYEQWVPAVLTLQQREVITAERNANAAWLSAAGSDSVTLRATSADAQEALAKVRRIPAIDAALKDMIWVQGRHTLFMRDVQLRGAGLLGRLDELFGRAASETNSR